MVKGLKLASLYKAAKAPIRIHEEIIDKHDGTAVYVLQAKFETRKDAEIYMEMAQLSEELEKEMDSE